MISGGQNLENFDYLILGRPLIYLSYSRDMYYFLDACDLFSIACDPSPQFGVNNLIWMHFYHVFCLKNNPRYI